MATQLGVFSNQAIAELNVLAEKYSKWFKTLQKNLNIWLENASPLEWSELEIQDPFGKLKRQNFERVIKSLSHLGKQVL